MPTGSRNVQYVVTFMYVSIRHQKTSKQLFHTNKMQKKWSTHVIDPFWYVCNQREEFQVDVVYGKYKIA